MSRAKVYIDVAYKDRDLAKRLGARWDAAVKRWYCPADSTLALIYKWRKAPAPGLAAQPKQLVPAANREARTVRSVKRVERTRAKSSVAPSLFDGNLELPLAS
jgi:hypothetical protein